MFCSAFLVCIFLLNTNNFIVQCSEHKITDTALAQDFLDIFNQDAEEFYYGYVLAAWKYNTNLTDYNQQRYVEASLRRSKFLQEAAQNTSMYDWSMFPEVMQREFIKIADAGISVLPEDLGRQFEELQAVLEATYSKATVCNKPGDDDPDKCYPLDPDLTALLAMSRDWDTLKWAWKGWRDSSGKKMRQNYIDMVKIMNKAANKLGYPDSGAYWKSMYDDDDFEIEVKRLWEEVKPLYQQLHMHVRRKLRAIYSEHSEKFPDSGHIPAHVLGNMWAQEWISLAKIVLPYPDQEIPDVTSAMIEQNYTITRMFKAAEDFFTSLGLESMPAPFWEHSMIEKPDGRDVVCHASAWDFYNRRDFRIKMCTVVTASDFTTIHHEMGHIQYYLQYQELPIKFRRGANPGFHEALGDVLALSVSTPEHLHKVGLLDKVINDTAYDLNFLMSMALDKIAFLPFGYLVDQWRWGVFKGEIPPDKYNEEWWQLRCKLQGVSPPVQRSEEDFDPGAKYHIPGNSPYIRYFVSFIIQFQFHKALCESAGHTGPLHRCDIYRSLEAGQKLKDTLKLGSSKRWQDAMATLTGERKMSAVPLMEYFQPIIDWLEKENQGESSWDESACPEGSFQTKTSPVTGSAHIQTLSLLHIFTIMFYVILK